MQPYVDPTEQLVVEVSVRDLERSKDFYTRLGFDVVLEKPGFVALAWEGHRFFLDERPEAPPVPAGSLPNVRILVPDVDACWQRACTMAAHVLRPIDDRDYGLRDFTILDPDGLGLRFATRLTTPRATDADEVIAFLAATPRRAAEAWRGLQAADLRWHPTGTGWDVQGHHFEWSLLQHLCHLRDLEREGYGVRIERLGREVEPFLADIDGDRLAAERNYDAASASRVGAEFETLRSADLRSARAALGSGRLGHGELEGTGSITLIDLLGFMRDHDAGHLAAMQRLADHLRAQPAPEA